MDVVSCLPGALVGGSLIFTSKYLNMARTNVKSQHRKYSSCERLE